MNGSLITSYLCIWTKHNVLFLAVREKSRLKDFCINYTIKSRSADKYLGIVLDNDLFGNSIVNNIIKKVNSRLKFLYSHIKVIDFNLKMLCNSLILCHFDYASSPWYTGLKKDLKEIKMQIVRNKIVRFIHGYHNRTSLCVCLISVP